jgi:hypothetical protein
LATIVVMTPMAVVVTKTASTRPLIERKPACGLSASRRAAINVPGRLERRHNPGADHCEPGPRDDKSDHDQQDPGEECEHLAVGGLRAVAHEVGQFAEAHEQRDHAVGAGCPR